MSKRETQVWIKEWPIYYFITILLGRHKDLLEKFMVNLKCGTNDAKNMQAWLLVAVSQMRECPAGCGALSRSLFSIVFIAMSKIPLVAKVNYLYFEACKNFMFTKKSTVSSYL